MSLKSLVLRASLASAVILPVLILSASATKPRQDQKPVLAPEKYKNIKVLTMLPADQLGPLMHKWNDALGVKCDFCHVIETTADGKHTGFEKDDKKMKLRARAMTTMCLDINKNSKVVEGKVTCFMCHRGKSEPDRNPPPAPAPDKKP